MYHPPRYQECAFHVLMHRSEIIEGKVQTRRVGHAIYMGKHALKKHVIFTQSPERDARFSLHCSPAINS